MFGTVIIDAYRKEEVMEMAQELKERDDKVYA